MRSIGCQPSDTTARNSQRAYSPRSANTITRPGRRAGGNPSSARPNDRSSASQCGFHAPLAAAGSTAQATGTAPPRYSTAASSTTNRSPSAVASSATARSGPSQSPSTHASSGPKHDPTSTSRRKPPRDAPPLLSVAPRYQSRSRSRAASKLWPVHRDRTKATQLSPHRPASTMPMLYSASTVTWGLLNCGNALANSAVHADNARGRRTGHLLDEGRLSATVHHRRTAPVPAIGQHQKPTRARGEGGGEGFSPDSPRRTLTPTLSRS